MNAYVKRKIKLQTPTIILIIGQIADCATTAIFLSLGGVEANPLPQLIGWPMTIVIKLLAIVVCIFLMETIIVKNKKYYVFKWIVSIYACFPAIWNILWIVTER